VLIRVHSSYYLWVKCSLCSISFMRVSPERTYRLLHLPHRMKSILLFHSVFSLSFPLGLSQSPRAFFSLCQSNLTINFLIFSRKITNYISQNSLPPWKLFRPCCGVAISFAMLPLLSIHFSRLHNQTNRHPKTA